MTAEVTRTFAALADPVRSAIVDRLAIEDATVGELAGMFTITIQAVSQQIGTLERAGLVTRHREGRTRRVRLQPARIDEASRWLQARQQRLEQRYQRLDDVLADVLNAESSSATASAVSDSAPKPGEDPS
jgi:DNA-binding transcriptional ArsR family regulator